MNAVLILKLTLQRHLRILPFSVARDLRLTLPHPYPLPAPPSYAAASPLGERATFVARLQTKPSFFVVLTAFP